MLKAPLFSRSFPTLSPKLAIDLPTPSDTISPEAPTTIAGESIGHYACEVRRVHLCNRAEQSRTQQESIKHGQEWFSRDSSGGHTVCSLGEYKHQALDQESKNAVQRFLTSLQPQASYNDVKGKEQKAIQRTKRFSYQDLPNGEILWSRTGNFQFQEPPGPGEGIRGWPQSRKHTKQSKYAVGLDHECLRKKSSKTVHRIYWIINIGENKNIYIVSRSSFGTG